MVCSHTISGLVSKRAELTGLIEHYQAQIRLLSASVDHLDATLQLFDSELDVSSIKPRGIRIMNPWFAPGEMARLALDTLRNAPEPLSTCNISDSLIALKGISIEGTKERDRLIKSLLGSLQRMRKQGVISIAGRIKGAGGGPLVWKIV